MPDLFDVAREGDVIRTPDIACTCGHLGRVHYPCPCPHDVCTELICTGELCLCIDYDPRDED